jgi:SET domain-containing protein
VTKSYHTGTSTIHGRGVFATRTIRRGAFIGQYLARRTDLDSPYTLWIEWEDGPRGYEGYGALRFVNHTATPNAEFLDRDLYATRTIRRGDEITVHYGDEWVEDS